MTKEGILVTGATGFIGRNLIPYLVERGYNVIGIDRHPNPGLPVTDYFEGDIARSNILDLIDAHVEQVIHLAADVDWCKDYNCIIDNVFSVYSLSNYVKKRNIRRVIFPSTAGVYNPLLDGKIVAENSSIKPVGLYSLTKYLAENALGIDDYSSIIFRISYIFGDGDNKSTLAEIINDVKMNRNPTVRQESRDYVHIKAVIDAFERALIYKGAVKVFNIGYGSLISMSKVASMVIEGLRKELEVNVTGIRQNVALDTTLAKNELKWEGSISIADYLQTLNYR